MRWGREEGQRSDSVVGSRRAGAVPVAIRRVSRKTSRSAGRTLEKMPSATPPRGAVDDRARATGAEMTRVGRHDIITTTTRASNGVPRALAGSTRHPDGLRPPAQALDDPHPGDVGVSGSRHPARAGDATIAAGSTTRGGRTRGEDTHPMFKVGYEVRRRARKKGRARRSSARLDADFPPARPPSGFGPYPQI